MQRQPVLLALVLASSIACNSEQPDPAGATDRAEPPEQPTPAATRAEPPASLSEPALLADPLAKAPDLVDPVSPASAGPSPEPELSDGMRCTPAAAADSLGRCEIERATIERLAQDPAALARQARIVPAMQDDITRGFKLYGIRSGSLPSQLGLQNGDLLVAFDGQPLASLDAAMAAFARLPALGSFTLTIERRGATQQLTIAIVEVLK